jgi:diamine N-acetyltransferase
LTSEKFVIRQAAPADAEALVALINELASYENLAQASRPNAQALREHLASDARPGCEALVAEIVETGTVAGMALYFFNYSTFLTRWGIFLEDLYVQEDYRGRGIGFALLKELARHAVSKGCERLDWNVLDWNELALGFYRKLGAEPMDEWTTMRLSGDALRRLAS